MASKKTKPTGDSKKRQEAIGELTGVSYSEGFGGLDEVCPHVDRTIEAELFPPIPAALKAEALELLRTWPTTWLAITDESCSALREEALRKLVERGLLEARLHVKNNAGREFLASAEFRLSAQGGYARDALASGDTESVVGWIFFDKFHGKAETVVEVMHDKADAANWPTLAPDDLRKLFHIEQDALVKRLKSQTIPNERITTKAYRVDSSALPDDWKQTLKRD